MPTKAQLQEELTNLKERLGKDKLEELGVDGPATTQRKSAIEEFTDYLENLPGSHTIEIYRHKRGGGQEYVGKVDLEAFDLDEIRKVFGGGKYVFIGKAPDGAYAFRRTIEIAGRAKQPPLHDDDDQSSRRDSSLEIIEQFRREFDWKLEQLRHAEPRTSTNPLQETLALLTAFQNSQAPLMKILMERAKEGPDMGEMFDLFLRGMELGREQGGSGDPMAAVASQLAAPLAKVLTGGIGPAQLPNIQGPDRAPPTQQEQVDMMMRPTWDLLLSQHLHRLQELASLDKDPDLYAEVFLDQLPAQADPLLAELVNKGEAFLAELFQLHPEMRPYEAWYRKLWARVSEAFQDEDPEQEEEANLASFNAAEKAYESGTGVGDGDVPPEAYRAEVGPRDSPAEGKADA